MICSTYMFCWFFGVVLLIPCRTCRYESGFIEYPSICHPVCLCYQFLYLTDVTGCSNQQPGKNCTLICKVDFPFESLIFWNENTGTIICSKNPNATVNVKDCEDEHYETFTTRKGEIGMRMKLEIEKDSGNWSCGANRIWSPAKDIKVHGKADWDNFVFYPYF